VFAAKPQARNNAGIAPRIHGREVFRPLCETLSSFLQEWLRAQITDVDGNTYLDYSLGWGPNILGNAPGQVTEAIRESVVHGLTFGAQHDLEYEVAEICRACFS
jgi:glutamate-1-semialdehyde aminotransferase